MIPNHYRQYVCSVCVCNRMRVAFNLHKREQRSRPKKCHARTHADDTPLCVFLSVGLKACTQTHTHYRIPNKHHLYKQADEAARLRECVQVSVLTWNAHYILELTDAPTCTHTHTRQQSAVYILNALSMHLIIRSFLLHRLQRMCTPSESR